MIRMSLQMDLKGLRNYQANLDRLGMVVSATAAMIERDAKKSILERGSRGNEYIRGGKIHYSAERGNPPNSDTGNLANSIKHKMTGDTSAEVSVEAEYAIPLEIGWQDQYGYFHGPFPFMVPAVGRHEAPFRKAVASILQGKTN
jgi:hypothetical protein